MKDILEAALKTAGDVVQGYAQKRFPDKSTAAEKHRLLMVIAAGFVIGTGVIVAVILIS